MSVIRPGEIWRDICGEPIRARSGSVIDVEGVWWWFGMDDGDRARTGGVRAYSSTDLVAWRDHGIVLAAGELPGGRLDSPKALRCPESGGVVLWFHLPAPGTAGVAFAAAAGETFGFLHGIRVDGGMTSDMTFFTDDDGRVWHLFRQPEKQGLHVAQLDATFTRHDGDAMRMLTGRFFRSPVVLKWAELYWLLAAGEDGEISFLTGNSLLGGWETVGNPCVGSEAQVDSFFNSRPACLLPTNGDAIILVADGYGGRHVWLPFDFRHGVPELPWHGAWSPAQRGRGGDELREMP
jgi:hypothetical protein